MYLCIYVLNISIQTHTHTSHTHTHTHTSHTSHSQRVVEMGLRLQYFGTRAYSSILRTFKYQGKVFSW